MSAPATRRFEVGMLSGLDEPVRRYLAHALCEGAPLHDGVRLTTCSGVRGSSTPNAS